MACVRARVLTSLAVAVLTMTAGSRLHAVQQPPTVRSGILVFEDINYGGRSRTFTVDVVDLRSANLDNRISSLVVAPGETWEVCVDRDYGGRCTLVTDRDSNLVTSGWNDRISSLRRVRSGGGFPGRGGGIGGSSLELFAGTNYSGQREVITEAVSDFRRIDFNDRAMSVRVRGTGSWELCVSADYDDCRVITGSVPDLQAIGLRRLASSARPRGFGRGGGVPPGGRDRLILYERANFQGASMTVESARLTLGGFNSRARSLRVTSGRWQICDSENYRGRCVIVTGDVRNLGTLQMDDRIESVRPR